MARVWDSAGWQACQSTWLGSVQDPSMCEALCAGYTYCELYTDHDSAASANPHHCYGTPPDASDCAFVPNGFTWATYHTWMPCYDGAVIRLGA